MKELRFDWSEKDSDIRRTRYATMMACNALLGLFAPIAQDGKVLLQFERGRNKRGQHEIEFMHHFDDKTLEEHRVESDYADDEFFCPDFIPVDRYGVDRFTDRVRSTPIRDFIDARTHLFFSFDPKKFDDRQKDYVKEISLSLPAKFRKFALHSYAMALLNCTAMSGAFEYDALRTWAEGTVRIFAGHDADANSGITIFSVAGLMLALAALKDKPVDVGITIWAKNVKAYNGLTLIPDMKVYIAVPHALEYRLPMLCASPVCEVENSMFPFFLGDGINGIRTSVYPAALTAFSPFCQASASSPKFFSVMEPAMELAKEVAGNTVLMRHALDCFDAGRKECCNTGDMT